MSMVAQRFTLSLNWWLSSVREILIIMVFVLGKGNPLRLEKQIYFDFGGRSAINSVVWLISVPSFGMK
jgi:hypothetical protein